MKNALDLYFAEAGKYDVLTKEEFKELAAAVKKGNKKAREKILNSNLRFVIKLAKEYKQKFPFASLEDLIASGNIGLIKALDKFDSSYNVAFTTYAQFWIRDEIKNELNLTHDIIIPRSSAKTVCQTMNTIADSIDEEGFREKRISNEYITNVEEEIERSETASCVEKAISTLTEQEQKIITLHYGIGCDKVSLSGISKICGGYSKETIRLWEADAIRKLRLRFGNTLLAGLCA